MSRNSGLGTPVWHRVAIWVIAVVTVGGTVAGMVFSIIATQNSNLNPTQIAAQKAKEDQLKHRQSADYKKQVEAWRKQMADAKKELRALEGFSDVVTPFDAASVTSLQVTTLQEGTGATIPAGATIKANYTGWTPDGQIFDSTANSTTTAGTPAQLPLDGVIAGWTEGLTGQRVGGIYELTIPADKAYGSQGSVQYYPDYESGSYDSDQIYESIPPDMPLKFIVQVVDIVAATK